MSAAATDPSSFMRRNLQKFRAERQSKSLVPNAGRQQTGILLSLKDALAETGVKVQTED
jgi:hypothetical protein